jgi:hypothetical protein
LEKRAEQVLPRSKGDVGEMEGVRAEGRNDPNNACTYEYMNKEKKILIILILNYICLFS